MDDTQGNVVALNNAYIEGNNLRGVTEDGKEVNSPIVRGAAVIQVGDIYNTPDCHYEVKSVKE